MNSPSLKIILCYSFVKADAGQKKQSLLFQDAIDLTFPRVISRQQWLNGANEHETSEV